MVTTATNIWLRWFHPIQMRSNFNRILFDFSIVDPISNQLKNRSFLFYEKWKEMIAHQNIYTHILVLKLMFVFIHCWFPLYETKKRRDAFVYLSPFYDIQKTYNTWDNNINGKIEHCVSFIYSLRNVKALCTFSMDILLHDVI